MSGFSDYLEDAILNWFKGTTFPAAPGTIYVALFNNDPTDTGLSGTEVTTTIRAAGRLGVTLGSLGDGTVSNSAVVDFGTSDGTVSVTHVAIYDAASSGNMLASAALASTVNVTAGDNVSFAIGALDFTVT